LGAGDQSFSIYPEPVETFGQKAARRRGPGPCEHEKAKRRPAERA